MDHNPAVRPRSWDRSVWGVHFAPHEEKAASSAPSLNDARTEPSMVHVVREGEYPQTWGGLHFARRAGYGTRTGRSAPKMSKPCSRRNTTRAHLLGSLLGTAAEGKSMLSTPDQPSIHLPHEGAS